jgi:hypothetical protein
MADDLLGDLNRTVAKKLADKYDPQLEKDLRLERIMKKMPEREKERKKFDKGRGGMDLMWCVLCVGDGWPVNCPASRMKSTMRRRLSISC